MAKLSIEEGLSVVVHEIKNSLAGILMGLQMLKSEVGENELLENILDEVERLFALTRDTITLSLPLDLELKENSIPEIIRSSIEVVKPEIEERNVTITLKFPDDFPPVLCDAEKMKSVFINLISNAVHYSPDGGKICLGGEYLKNNMVRIWIKDEGPGMKQNELDAIFRKFYTKRQGGMGVGLALVHKVVYEHFGVIDVESEPGKGTRFIITMPTDFHFVERRRGRDRRSGQDRRKRR